MPDDSKPQEDHRNSNSSVDIEAANSSQQEGQGLRERQSSFWDFSGDGAVDVDPTIRTLSKKPSIEEMLSLSDTTNSEVFI